MFVDRLKSTKSINEVLLAVSDQELAQSEQKQSQPSTVNRSNLRKAAAVISECNFLNTRHSISEPLYG